MPRAMSIRTHFPRAVRRIDHTWIPMSDGTRLAARLWLPEDAERDPVPAILEYLPYRKGDAFAKRDTHHHPWFAGHGYAGVRVDLRGSGDSDGILLDEYLPQEQDDGLEVIAWLAEQPWCSGAVGMIGISWGGFNGLQIAARRPPALKAVISMCASDDRYADDVHYVGGCVLGVDMLSWAATMLTLTAMPPDPAAVGEGWRATWLERMERSPSMVEAWLTHQRRDDFWRQASVCEDYAAIEAPVYAVGGWADGYSNAVPRLVEGLPGPRKGLIGPWSHAFPQDGEPGPAIGFLQECKRWWDRWLKGIDNGIEREPVLRAWMQDTVAPATHHAERPGRWVTETAWPPPNVRTEEWELEADFPLAHRSIESTGADAGAWCADGGEGDWPADQRAEDERSLTFDFAPLAEPLEILGFPELRLELSADRPSALVAVRLCGVAPDGASLLVTRGLLNLTHRDGQDRADPLEPGSRYELAVCLDAIAHSFPAGQRLRVGISSAYWPWAWPSPRAGHADSARRPPAAARAPAARRAGAAAVRGARMGRAARRGGAGAGRDAPQPPRRPRRRPARARVRMGRGRAAPAGGGGHRDARHQRQHLPDRGRRAAIGRDRGDLHVGARPRRLADPRGDRQPHELDRHRVPGRPEADRLRGRRAGLRTHLGAALPARRRLAGPGV